MSDDTSTYYIKFTSEEIAWINDDEHRQALEAMLGEDLLHQIKEATKRDAEIPRGKPEDDLPPGFVRLRDD